MADTLSREFDRLPQSIHFLKESLLARRFDVPAKVLTARSARERRETWRWLAGRRKRPAWLKEYAVETGGKREA